MDALRYCTRLIACFIVLGISCAYPAASADKVGVAAAVNPDAFSGGTKLNIGKPIFYNERIQTSAQGLVQVLLIDGSTFTVGPGSDLTIDKFVYDPKRQSGQMAASLTKGVMRFVGGKISKAEGGVTVSTPAGALAIRGGMVLGNVKGSRGVFLFLYGDEMRLKRPNGEVLRTFQPGYKIDTSSGIGEITSKDVHFFMQAFSKGVVKQAVSKGKGGDRRITPGSNTEADIKNDAAYSRILGDILSAPGVNTPARDNPPPGPPNGGPPTPPPPPPTVSGPPFGWGAGGTPRCSPNCTDPRPNR